MDGEAKQRSNAIRPPVVGAVTSHGRQKERDRRRGSTDSQAAGWAA